MPKPELTNEEAAFLVNKTDCELPTLGSHHDRSNFQAVLAKLVMIANWQEDENVQTDEPGEGGESP